jgi:hypothetical protein
MKTSLMTGHDSRSILTAMLQNRQAIIERLVDRTLTYYADNATHMPVTLRMFC